MRTALGGDIDGLLAALVADVRAAVDLGVGVEDLAVVSAAGHADPVVARGRPA